MDEVWRGPFWTLPFLLLGSTRRVLFPSRGRDVPFTIENYAYVDSFGRETVTFARRFRMKRRVRAFDATMIMSEQRGTIVDYLGTHQHLAVVLARLGRRRRRRCGCAARPSASTRGRSGSASRCSSPASPMCANGGTRRTSDSTSTSTCATGWFGKLFGYRGSFTVEERPCTRDQIPVDVLPVREERRE